MTLPLSALPMQHFMLLSDTPAGIFQRLGGRPWSRNNSFIVMNLALCRSQWPPSADLAAVRHGEQFIIVVGRRFLTEHTAGVRCGADPLLSISVNAFTSFLRATAPGGKTVKSAGPGLSLSSKHDSKHRLSADTSSGHLKGWHWVLFSNMITNTRSRF